MFKFLISLIIVGCSSAIGIIYANSYIDRTKLLACMLSTMQILETEIIYGSTPLPDILSKIAQKSRREIANIFLGTKKILDKNRGLLFYEAWQEAVNLNIKDTSFDKDDIDLLLTIGKNLGISDSNDQAKHISLIKEEIRRNYELAIIEQNKNVKLCRSFGFLIGITIVIIFI